MTDTIVGALYGVGATLLMGIVATLVAYKVGFRQARLMQEAHDLSVTRAETRIGCAVEVEDKQVVLPAGMYNPHIHLTAKIYNEGELPAEDINGEWKLLTNNPWRSVSSRSKEIF
jgi:hypothetical protein